MNNYIIRIYNINTKKQEFEIDITAENSDEAILQVMEKTKNDNLVYYAEGL